MKEIIKEMISLFAHNNIPVFGTAKASYLENEPSGYRSSDMLASAQSILCFGIPVPKGIFKSLTGLFPAACGVIYMHKQIIPRPLAAGWFIVGKDQNGRTGELPIFTTET